MTFMAKIGVFYGSSTGTCEDVAGKIAAKLNGAEVLNAADLTADSVAAFDVLLLGSSTWGAGELQDDWYDACDTLHSLNLKGKKVALSYVRELLYYKTFLIYYISVFFSCQRIFLLKFGKIAHKEVINMDARF